MKSLERLVQFRAPALMIAEVQKPKRTRKSPKPHWYKIFVGECPVCGTDHGYRVRMYTDRPEDIKDRYEYLPYKDTYDYCQEGSW